MLWRQVVASQETKDPKRFQAVIEDEDPSRSLSGFERDFLALNQGGSRFLDVSGISGADSITDGRAGIFADFDNDGDLDILVTAWAGADSASELPMHLLYRNDVGQDAGSLRVTLEGRKSGRDAFGAEVRVKTSAGILTKVKAGGSGYLSEGDPRLLFGLGRDAGVEWIDVKWPSGARQRFGPAPRGESLRLVEGESRPRHVDEKRFRLAAGDPVGPNPAWSRLLLHAGDPFPALDLSTPGEDTPRPVELGHDGKEVLVNFWATWCGSCEAEIRALADLHAREGLHVVGVSLDDAATRQAIPAFLARNAVRYPVYVAADAALDRIFPSRDIKVPLSVLLDARGRVVDVFTGWSLGIERRVLGRDGSKPKRP